MIQGLAAKLCRFDKYTQILDHLALSTEVVESKGAQRIFKVALGCCGRVLLGSYIKCIFVHILRQRYNKEMKIYGD
jgi:hypothetical protein